METTESKYLNPVFENYQGAAREGHKPGDYYREITYEDDLLEPNFEYSKLADLEVSQADSINQILEIKSIVKDIKREEGNKAVIAALIGVFTIGAIASILSNRDLTYSLTNQIESFGGVDKLIDAVKQLNNVNYAFIGGAAISWVGYIKNGRNLKKLNEKLGGPIDYLKVNSATESTHEGRTR